MKRNYPISRNNHWNPVPINNIPDGGNRPERIDGRIVMPDAVKVGYNGSDRQETEDEDLFTMKLKQAVRNRGEIRIELNRGIADELDTP